MMDDVVAPFAELVRKVRLSPPRLPFVSTATGEWITAEQATDPEYWAKHLRAPVRFSAGIARLLSDTNAALLEVGPRAVLATLAKQVTQDKTRLCVASLSDADEGAWSSLLGAAGKLWVAGAALSPAIHGEGRRRVPFSTYRFERRSYWVDVAGPHARGAARVEPSAVPPDASARACEPSPRSTERAAQLGRIFGEQLRLMNDHLDLIAGAHNARKN
jgi:acyl transferase domain-containing protein